MLPASGSEQHVWSYKVMHIMSALLGLGVHRKGQALHQGWLPPTLSLQAGGKRSKVPELHLHLPPSVAACEAPSLKDPLVIGEFCEVGSQ